MTTIQAIILGIVQGVAEFLPISSSGHLQLAKSLLDFKDLDKYLFFDLACHLGTLLAIFVIFSNEIKSAFSQKKKILQIATAMLPLFPLLLILKPIKEVFAHPQYLGFFFFANALVLYIGIRYAGLFSQPQSKKRQWLDPFLIGTCQACAVLPGVSRSGSTITGARLLGWSMREAIAFSFLLAIPTIIGAMTVESLDMIHKGESPFLVAGLSQYAAGFFTSFLVGLAALQLLINVAGKNKFVYFVWYSLFIGIIALLIL